MIGKLFVSTYILAGVMAYGHFWNNSETSWSKLDKPTVGFLIAVLHPLYWSTVAFEVGDD